MHGDRKMFVSCEHRSLTIWLDAQVRNEVRTLSQNRTIKLTSINESLIPAQNQRWRRA